MSRDPFRHLPRDFRVRVEAAAADPRPEAPSEKELEAAREWAQSTPLAFPEALELVQALGPSRATDLLEKLLPGPPEAPESWWTRFKALPIFRWGSYFQKNGHE